MYHQYNILDLSSNLDEEAARTIKALLMKNAST